MRERLRELGYRVGRLPPGPSCSLVDVPGVRVGHCTLPERRTGVTAVLPHDGNLYAEKVLAACHVVNGYGKATGLSQLEELGTLESPILLTNTLAVGAVWEGGLRHVLEQNPDAARDRDTINVVVGECFDGWLSDARALPVRPEHALEAIAAASADETGEGARGRRHGHDLLRLQVRGRLLLAGARRRADARLPGGVELRRPARPAPARGARDAAAEHGPGAPSGGGSIMIVLGTDAPLSERQLRRLAGARPCSASAARAASPSNGSGEYALAFSTAQRIPHRSDSPTQDLRFLRDDSSELRLLFEAAAEATHEAILNSLCTAEAVEGRDGHRAEAFPVELLDRVAGVSPL